MKSLIKHNTKGCLPQLFAAVSLCFIASGSFANKEIIDRSKEIVKKITGSETNFLGATRAPEKPGLSNATLVTFSDKGVPKTFVMLRDGKTLILGNIIDIEETFSQTSAGAGANDPQKTVLAPQPSPGEEIHLIKTEPSHPIKTVGDAFDPQSTATGRMLLLAKKDNDANDVKLTVHDFRADAFSKVFPDVDNKQAVNFYIEMLKKTNQIKEGESKDRVFVFYDPLCPYCIKEHKALRPYIDNGDFSVSWVPVATASRPPYTHLLRLLDTGLSNDQRLDKLKYLIHTRPKASTVIINNKEEAQQRLVYNGFVMGLLRSRGDWLKSGGTPQMIIEKENGELYHLRGLQKEGVVSGIINQ